MGFNSLDYSFATSFSLGDIDEFRALLSSWYECNRRDLPWRRSRDPYAIWVSEIMLQQTRVAAVIDKFNSFLSTFPTVRDLAEASEQDVLAQWSGLGYYRRARMLHQAAKFVVTELGGRMPSTAKELRLLSGIGAYTSAAIASIAFGEPVAVVDGNVERVVQRLAGWGSDSTSGQAKLLADTGSLAAALLDSRRAGDHNQAMMELGATVCLPQKPTCLVCPVRPLCVTQGEHPTAKRAPMTQRDVAHALVIRHGAKNLDEPSKFKQANTEILLDQRSPEQTVMPGLWELPLLADADVPEDKLRLTVRHSIMQVNYMVRIRNVSVEEAVHLDSPSSDRRWVDLKEAMLLPLTGLTRKVLLRGGLLN